MKVLMVLTSHDQLGDTGRKTGFWLEELAGVHTIVDGLLITGQNPASSGPAAKALTQKLNDIESGLVSGAVAYDPAPIDPPAEGSVLICCSKPQGDAVIDL
jgi:hypothetical protein